MNDSNQIERQSIREEMFWFTSRLRVGTNSKNPPKMRIMKMVEIDWLYCNGLIPFKYEGYSIIGNGNKVNLLKLTRKILWKHNRWTYFWRVLAICNHCVTYLDGVMRCKAFCASWLAAATLAPQSRLPKFFLVTFLCHDATTPASTEAVLSCTLVVFSLLPASPVLRFYKGVHHIFFTNPESIYEFFSRNFEFHIFRGLLSAFFCYDSK